MVSVFEESNFTCLLSQKNAYLFTITFRSASLAEKDIAIKKFDKQLIRWLKYCEDTIDANLIVVREYHKKKKYHGVNAKDAQHLWEIQSTYAPHLHGILLIDQALSSGFIRYINSEMFSKYGRCQFNLCEEKSECEDWLQYCYKHVEWNNSLYDISHMWRTDYNGVYIEHKKPIVNCINEKY